MSRKHKMLKNFSEICEYDEEYIARRTGLDIDTVDRLLWFPDATPITEDIAKKLCKLFPFDEKYWMS